MIVNQKKLYDATVALSVRLAASEPGSFLSEQIGYLIPVLDQINIDLQLGGESILEVERRIHEG